MSEQEMSGGALWQLFLDDGRERLARARVVCEALKIAPRASLKSAAGELFAIRTAAALLGVGAIGRAAGAMERALDRAAAGAPWERLGPLLVRGASTLAHAFAQLTSADESGAHVDEAPLDEIARELDAGPARALAEDAARPTPIPQSSSALTNADAATRRDETRWVPQVDEDMVDPFLEEATERLDGLSQKLLRLEQAPRDLELVREIFRDLHTVKGSSGFVGLTRMNRLAHAAEDLVGQVRDKGRVVDRALVDVLLAALDGLRAILERAQARAPIDVPLDGLLARLHDPGGSSTAALAQVVVQSEPLAATGEAHAAITEASASGGAPRQTLRVDFDKLDRLLNLVGELVLNKAALHHSVAGFSSLRRELEGQIRRARRVRAQAVILRVGGETGTRESTTKLLDDLDRAARVFDELAHDLDTTVARVDHVAADLRQQVMKLRMLPIARVFTKYHRTVRELAHGLGKTVRLEIEGAETELDKVLVEQLDEPLLHLVRNAVDHGCEMPTERVRAGKPAEGTLRLAARHQGNQIHVEVSDDGAGIEPARLRAKALEKSLATEEELAAMDDRAVLDIIFRPGFSTAARVSEVSGRGVGMDVVREAITRLKGSIDIASTPGVGTTFTLKLPLTLAIIQVLLVRVAGYELAIPLDAVKRTLTQRADKVLMVHRRPMLLEGGEEIPIIPLAIALDLEGTTGNDEEVPMVIVEVLGEPFALICDRLVGKQEIVIKTLGDLLEEVPCVGGATLIGDRVALILDVAATVRRGVRRFVEGAVPLPPGATGAPPIPRKRSRPRVLIAEDSDVIRESLRRLLEAHGYEAVGARDGAEAWSLAESGRFDAVSTDVMMPNVDGYELTRRLRASERHRGVPILMVTARGEKIDRVRGFDAGVDEYITKPLDHGEILRALERQIARHRGEGDVSQGPGA